MAHLNLPTDFPAECLQGLGTMLITRDFSRKREAYTHAWNILGYAGNFIPQDGFGASVLADTAALYADLDDDALKAEVDSLSATITSGSTGFEASASGIPTWLTTALALAKEILTRLGVALPF